MQLAYVACELDDDKLIQAFVDDYVHCVAPLPEECEDEDQDGGDDATVVEKFDRAAVIGSKLSRRKKLFACYRWKVIETKTWKKNGRMPGKGKDLDFDNFTQAIGCPKRKNASDAWLLYRKSLGVVLASKIFADKSKLVDEYNKQTSNKDGH